MQLIRHFKNFKMAVAAILNIERNDFSNSESLCLSNTSSQVSAQSDFWFGRQRLKTFKTASMVAIMDIKQNNLAILNLCVPPMLPMEFWLNPTYGLPGNVI